MKEERLRLRTYRQVWHLERMVYRIERVPLPFPISATQAGLFAGALVLAALLSRLPPVEALPLTIRYLAAPLALTWFLTRQSLDGRPPHRWLCTMAVYLAEPKRLGRLQPLPPSRRVQARVAVAWRAAPASGESKGDVAGGVSRCLL